MDIILIKRTVFLKGQKQSLFHIKEIGKPYQTQVDNLNISGVKKIISFDFSNIIPHMVIKNDIDYFDLELVNKQLIGRSKNEYTAKNLPWSLWNALRTLNHTDFKISKEVFNKRISDLRKFYLGLDVNIDIPVYITFFMECLEKFYIKLNSELLISVELERYNNIEKKLNNILFSTTNKGINVDKDKIKKYIKEIEIDLYRTRNKLQLEYGIFSKYDYERIQFCLKNLIPKHIKFNSKKYWSFIKSNSTKNELFETIIREKKLSKNKTILTRVGALDDDKINPNFNYFGTITGRILVEKPSLQQLKKDYRDIIVPAMDKEFLYFDYSQFEAGLLASKADDANLIKMYNQEDIYNGMIQAIGVDQINRDEAKEIFYLYCYGSNSERNNNAFFDQFPKLIEYENQIFQEFVNKGYVDTDYGNRRYKTNNLKDLKEDNWLLSQKIQGLASIILKEVLIEVNEKYSEVDFLLPMHDAILYQVPKEKIKEYEEKIKKVFVSVMKQYCPKLEPKVLLKEFIELT